MRYVWHRWPQFFRGRLLTLYRLSIEMPRERIELERLENKKGRGVIKPRLGIPAFVGDPRGNTDYVCPGCGYVLLDGVGPTTAARLSNAAVQCPKCAAILDLPGFMQATPAGGMPGESKPNPRPKKQRGRAGINSTSAQSLANAAGATKPPRVPRTRNDLLRQLHQQIGFLERSAASYDQGFEDEAKRLAITLRVLLYDKKKSHSVLTQLGILDKLKFQSLSPLADEHTMYLMGIGTEFKAGRARYKPAASGVRARLPFSEWWNGVILLNPSTRVRFTRADAVLALANTDGGGHVDPALDAEYAALSRGNAFGAAGVFIGSPVGPDNEPILPLVRQVAEEVMGTLKEQVKFGADPKADKRAD